MNMNTTKHNRLWKIVVILRTVSQFQEWCEKKGYEISTDIEASYTDCLMYLKDMIKENKSVEKKKQNISYYHER